MRYVAVALVVGLALIVGAFAQRRRPAPPVRTGWNLPEQLDRADFARPEAPFLVAVFTSVTCATCAEIMRKVEVLAGDAVAVHEAEFGRDRRLHERYGIDAVPAVLIADSAGVVRTSFLGPTTASDLWAAMAELRETG